MPQTGSTIDFAAAAAFAGASGFSVFVVSFIVFSQSFDRNCWRVNKGFDARLARRITAVAFGLSEVIIDPVPDNGVK